MKGNIMKRNGSKMLKAFALTIVVFIMGGYALHQNLQKEKFSDVMLENLEALARYELPEIVIDCSGGSYGTCQICHRYDIYDPLYGWGYGYECVKTGDMADFCSSGCDSNGGGSFPG